MTPALEMKDLLLDIIGGTFETSDITATQQMGVNLSNTVRKDGVVIIQNQNVEIYARIMPKMVKALRLCDAIGSIQIKELPPVVPQLTQLKDDPIDECCGWMFENRIGWEDMQTLMKNRYMEYALDHLGTKKDTAAFLKIQPSYLSKLTSILNPKEE